MKRLLCVLAVGEAVAFAGCGDGDGVTDPTNLSTTQIERLSSRLGIAAVAVAAGSEGHGFLDNYVACPRRGVIDYSNTAGGRRVTFSGCDLGDGVVVDGSGELQWAQPASVSDRAPFCRESATGYSCATDLEWQGALAVTVDGSRVTVGSFTVTGLSMASGGVHFPNDLPIESPGLSSMQVKTLQTTTTVNDASLVTSVFDPLLTIGAIPNPSNDLAVLTEADLKRIAFQGALELVAQIFFETLDWYSPHTHDLGCGTSEVVVNDGYPEMINSWSDCESAGTHYSGNFTVKWDVPSMMAGSQLAVLVEGELTLGGGLPTIVLEHLTWSIEFDRDLSDETRFSGSLRTATGSRTFDFRIIMDD